MFAVGDIVRLKPREECSRSYRAHHFTAKVTKSLHRSQYYDYDLIKLKWIEYGANAVQGDGGYRASDFELVDPHAGNIRRKADLIPRFQQVAEEL